MSNEELIILAEKIEKGKANKQEMLLYAAICESFQKEQVSLEGMEAEILEMQEAGLRKFWIRQSGGNIKKQPLWPRMAVAAVAALVIVAVGLFYYSDQTGKGLQGLNYDIAPGKNTATLTLGNGKKIQLSDSKTGLVINSTELHYNDGSVVASDSVLRKIVSETMTQADLLMASTPRGGTYQVILSDGTHVWLNADSKLKFPSRFTGNSRTVILSGEGYFEVAHNKLKPFKVISEGQEIQVLGTHFNVNAYPDEGSTKTTLLTGSVKINEGITLKPGEQAIATKGELRVSKADIEEAVAWKNGFFIFKDSDLAEVMRQLSRWYDLDVEFKGPVPQNIFNGKVYRNMSLNDVLDVLSFSKVKFKIQGKRMTIYP